MFLVFAVFGALSLRLHESALNITAPLHDDLVSDLVSDQPTLVAATNAKSPVSDSKNRIASVTAQSSNAIQNTKDNEPTPATSTTRIHWNNDAMGEDDIERALFVICMGEKATQSTVVERFVYSARKAGMFTGWIVVLTDAPPDRYAALSNWTDHLLFLQPQQRDLKKDYILANTTYKRFKTLILDYLDREPKLKNVELVYYLDADIVIGNALGGAFRGLERTYGIGRLGANANKTTSMDAGARGKIWMFQGNLKRWPLQSGQIVLDRRMSPPCLERWRRGFDGPDSRTLRKDQNILREMKKEMEEAIIKNSTLVLLDCELVKMKQAPYVEFPSVATARTRSAYLENHPNYTYSNSYSPMVHLRNDGGFANADQSKIQLFLRDLLRLSEGQQDPLGVTKKIEMDTKKENEQTKNRK